MTEAVIEYFLKRDESGNRWRGSSNRPPSEASDFTATYLALRALSAYGNAGNQERISARVKIVRRWLEATAPKDTEDRVFRLLAMRAASSLEATIQMASDELLATRREEGAGPR